MKLVRARCGLDRNDISERDIQVSSFSLIAFADLSWELLFEEAFIKVIKPSVSILEAGSVHFSLSALLFNRSDSVDSSYQSCVSASNEFESCLLLKSNVVLI